MRVKLLLLICLITHGYCYCNTIDSLKTKEQLVKFVNSVNPRFATSIIFAEAEDKSWQKSGEYRSNNFYFVDIDQNGLTDILIDGKYCFLILDKGGGYEFLPIEYGADKYSFKKTIHAPGMPVFLLLNNYRRGKDLKARKTDTIIYRNGALVEYNMQPDKLDINRLSLSTSGCYGFCPVFSIEFLKNGFAFYNAIKYNDDEGCFFGKIRQESLDSLFDLISYCDVMHSQNSYSVPWTDDERATLRIELGNGKSKIISDYGMVGTLGLRAIYNQLLSLRANKWAQWYEISTGSDSLMLSFTSSFNTQLERQVSDSNVLKSIPWDVKFRSVESVQYVSRGYEINGANVRYASRGYVMDISLDQNSTFIFKLQQDKSPASRLSFGKWSVTNDSILHLNWNGPVTLKACRDEKIYENYIRTSLRPTPLRIENWHFVFSKDRKMLNASH